MAQIRCPKCSTLVLADPGETIRCPTCGFSATAPPTSPAPSDASASSTAPPPAPVESRPLVRLPKPPSKPPVPTAAGNAGQPLKVLSIWAFLLAFVALGTFHFARYGIPFMLGAAAAIMGILAFAKNHQDRHGLVATILGCVSLAIGAVYLAVQ